MAEEEEARRNGEGDIVWVEEVWVGSGKRGGSGGG